jgi:hypothetical protein
MIAFALLLAAAQPLPLHKAAIVAGERPSRTAPTSKRFRAAQRLHALQDAVERLSVDPVRLETVPGGPSGL